jgi:hypothetical protein
MTLTRAEAQHESWHRGRLLYKLHGGQRRIEDVLRNLPGQLRVVCCSRQFGKTYWGVVKAISLCLRKPHARVKIGTAFLSDLAELILPAFEEILKDCPEAIRPVYKDSKKKWVFGNGSEIKLVGLDKNPNGLRGQVPDLIILEEAGFIDCLQYLYKSILVPATTHRPDCEIVFISTPPSTPAHAFVDFAQRAKLEDCYAEFTIFDNPMIGPDTVLRLMKESGCSWPCDTKEALDTLALIAASTDRKFPVSWTISSTFKREYLCEFILDDDLALVREWRDEFIQTIPRDQYYGYYHKLVGQDLGRKDHTALIFGYYDFKRAALIIEDELIMDGPQWTTKTLRDAVRKKEWELWADDKTPYIAKADNSKETQFVNTFRRVTDNNNPHLINDLASLHDLHFMQVKKDSSLEQMVNRVREWTKQGRIIIDPKCKYTIGCMKYGVWNKTRKEFARSEVYGHFDHFAALMYLLIHTPTHSNPIPADHGFEQHRSWLHNIRGEKTPNATAIGNLYGPNRKINSVVTPENMRSIIKNGKQKKY